MILFQVLINNKYLAYFMSILVVFISNPILSALNIESNMMFIASAPSLLYSDMNGFGPGLEGALWFNLYWILFAFICLQLAAAFWNRGTQSSIKERLQLAKKQVPQKFKPLIIANIILWFFSST